MQAVYYRGSFITPYTFANMTDAHSRPHVLCALAELGQGESRAFDPDDGAPYPLFVIRQHEQVYAYRNMCPHTGAPLNWGRDQFLNFDSSLIQCTLHGAQFRISDGYCVWGPCVRQRLSAVPVLIEDGMIVITVTDNGDQRAGPSPHRPL